LIRDLNNLGQMVGTFVSADGLTSHGFMYDHGAVTVIDAPASTYTELWALNDVGQMVGYYGVSQGHPVSFVYSEGIFTSITVPGATDTVATKINNGGQIVGTCSPSPDGQVNSGFITTDGVNFTYISVDGARLTGTFGINSDGIVTGFYDDANGLRHG